MLFQSEKKKKKAAAKTYLVKKVLNSGIQKKAITRAARESAIDQKNLVARYNELVNRKALPN